MITQAQYNRLCAAMESERGLQLLYADVADLLESFEQLHAALDRELMRTGGQSPRSFALLFDEEGEYIVELKKPAPKTIPLSSFPQIPHDWTKGK